MSDAEPTAAEANVDTLRKVLELESLSFTSASRESDYFLGQNQYKPDGRVYGGQVVAQSVVAAAATCQMIASSTHFTATSCALGMSASRLSSVSNDCATGDLSPLDASTPIRRTSRSCP